jgi:hypothetical protein
MAITGSMISMARRKAGWGARGLNCETHPGLKVLKTFVFRHSGKSFCHTRMLQGSAIVSYPSDGDE